MTKNEAAWNSLFSNHNILDKIAHQGFFKITAKEINKVREARLMAKFDHHSQLPSIFKQHKLSILPIRRGEYIIGPFKTFYTLEHNSKLPVATKEFPSDFQTLSPNNIFSETVAINCAFLSGMIDDIADEKVHPTLAGRMSSGNFEFSISISNSDNFSIEVSNSQCEIDGCFEGLSSIVLIEAKNVQSDDINIRQLYYPFRNLKESTDKTIIPVFLMYSNDVFTFFIFDFAQTENYNSITLQKTVKFSFAPEEITLDNIQRLLRQTKARPEPPLPFPQADKFDRLVDLIRLLNVSALSTEEISSNYDFDPRQAQYYTRAGMYLGLIEKAKKHYWLTVEGRRLLQHPIKERKLGLVEKILEHKAFKETLNLYIKKLDSPTIEEIVNIMKVSHLYNINSSSTYRRRAQTILKWVEWILDLQNETNNDSDMFTV